MKVPKKILRKLEKPRRGPLTVIEHHGNGTAATQKSPCAAGSMSARRLGPFFGKEEAQRCGGGECSERSAWGPPPGAPFWKAP